MKKDNFFAVTCLYNNFYGKKNHYFRIVGDNILQCICYEYHPRFHESMLYFGMVSMYSSLAEDYFTPKGFDFCIYGTRAFANDIRKFNDLTDVQKSEIFEQIIMPRFNSVLAQDDLINAYDEFEVKEYGQVLMNNKFRIAPYLKCGEYQKASAVIDAILYQHKNALEANRRTFNLNDDEYAKQLKEMQKEDGRLSEISEMIKSGSFEEISDMLEYNLQSNTAFAKKHFA